MEVDGLVYREGLNAVGISGGVAGNVIPDECMVHVNYRFAPRRSPGGGGRARRARSSRASTCGSSTSPAGARPGPRRAGRPRLRRTRSAPSPRPKYGWTDVARFSGLGVPAVNYGPGDPLLAHADDERVPVDQIHAVEAGLRAWLTRRLTSAAAHPAGPERPRALAVVRGSGRRCPGGAARSRSSPPPALVTTLLFLWVRPQAHAGVPGRARTRLARPRQRLGRPVVLVRRRERLPGGAAAHRLRRRRHEPVGLPAPSTRTSSKALSLRA